MCLLYNYWREFEKPEKPPIKQVGKPRNKAFTSLCIVSYHRGCTGNKALGHKGRYSRMYTPSPNSMTTRRQLRFGCKRPSAGKGQTSAPARHGWLQAADIPILPEGHTCMQSPQHTHMRPSGSTVRRCRDSRTMAIGRRE